MLNARSTEPSRRPASLMPSASCPGVEAVVDAHVRDQPGGQRGGHRVARFAPDEGDTRPREASGGLDEPQRGLQQIRGDEDDVGHRPRTVPLRQPGVTRRPQYHAALGGRRRRTVPWRSWRS